MLTFYVLCSSPSDTDDLSDQTYAALDINIYICAYTYTYTYVSYKVSTCVIAHFVCVFSSLLSVPAHSPTLTISPTKLLWDWGSTCTLIQAASRFARGTTACPRRRGAALCPCRQDTRVRGSKGGRDRKNGCRLLRAFRASCVYFYLYE